MPPGGGFEDWTIKQKGKSQTEKYDWAFNSTVPQNREKAQEQFTWTPSHNFNLDTKELNILAISIPITLLKSMTQKQYFDNLFWQIKARNRSRGLQTGESFLRIPRILFLKAGEICPSPTKKTLVF